MWQTLRTFFRMLVPILIGLITLLLPVLPSILGDLDQGLTRAFAQSELTITPTPTITSSPAEEEVIVEEETTETPSPIPTSTPTPTATLQPAEIEPDQLSIRQQLGFLRSIGWKWNTLPDPETPTPTYPSASLSIYVDQTQAPQVNIFHPPLNDEQGVIDVAVSQNTPCSALMTPITQPKESTQHMDLNCYSVGVPVGTLSPGEYTARLFVDIADQPPQTVNVNLKVRAHPLWIFLMVAVGVLATEFLVYWNRRWWYSVSWRARREEWFDMLTQRLNWIFGKNYSNTAYEGHPVVTKTRSEIRKQIDDLRLWLKMGRDGELKLAHIPRGAGEYKDMLLPLDNAIQTHLDEPDLYWGEEGDFGRLVTGFKDLSEAVNRQSREHLDQAFQHAGRLYAEFQTLVPEGNEASGYLALKTAYQKGLLKNESIRTAWKAIEIIKREGTSWQAAFDSSIRSLPRNTLSQKAEACRKLAENLAGFRTGVPDKAAEQLAQVEALDVSPKPEGRLKIISLLRALSDLVVVLEKAELRLRMANEPLRFCPEATVDGVGKQMHLIEQTLDAMQARIDEIEPGDIKADATISLMLKNIREHLKNAEKQMSENKDEASLGGIWRELSILYNQDERFSRLGERIFKHTNGETIDDPHLQRAYRLLLEEKYLDAEIELERAKWHRNRQLPAARTSEGDDPAALFTELSQLRVRYSNILSQNEVATRFDNLMEHIPQQPISRRRKRLERWRTDLQVNHLPLYGVMVILFIGFALTLVGYVWNKLFPVWNLTEAPVSLIFSATTVWILGLAVLFAVLLAIAVTRRAQIRSFLADAPGRLGKGIKKRSFAVKEAWTDNEPRLSRLLASFFSQLLTVFVATALVIVTYQIAQKADTWGKPFDFLAAFVWGVIANRLAEPAKSGWEKLIEGIAKPADPAAPGG